MRKKNNSKTVKQAVKPVEVKKEETVVEEFKEWQNEKSNKQPIPRQGKND